MGKSLYKQPPEVTAYGLSAALTSFVNTNSAVRMQMSSAQIQQTPPPAQPDISRIMHGLERQLGEHTYGVKVPADIKVIAAVPLYRTGLGATSVRRNSLVTVIYQREDNGVYGKLDIIDYHKSHETFGVRHKVVDNLSQLLRPGNVIPKDTMLTKTPSIQDAGIWTNGVSANVCYLAVPGTIEDGFVVSESLCDRLTPLSIEKRSARWGKNKFPINLYGDENTYKPFPGIGDKIRSDGLVFAMREMNNEFSAIDMLPDMLRKPDLVHDELVYAPNDAEVIDVRVLTTTNEKRRNHNTPVGMEVYAKMHSDQQSDYYDSIISIYEGIVKTNRGADIDHEFQNFLVYAYGDKPSMRNAPRNYTEHKGNVTRTLRAAPLDEWYVEITYQLKYPVRYGGKLANAHGGKGVICSIMPDEDMPTDKFGNRADCIIFGGSVVARLNPGQLYEQYINACSRDVANDVRGMMEQGHVDQAWTFLLEYYSIVSPDTHQAVMEVCTHQKAINRHLQSVCDEGIYIMIPVDNQYVNPDLYTKLQNFRPPNRSPVTFRNFDGQMVTTNKDVLIGEQYLIGLEKTSFKPMAVSVSRRQHHGLPATTNRTTRHASPTTEQACRWSGESEVRQISANVGGEFMTEILDYTLNPESTKSIVRKLFTQSNPMEIEKAVDRKEIPLGNSRALGYMRHIYDNIGIRVKDAQVRKK